MYSAKTMADKAIDDKRKAEHIEKVVAIVEAGYYTVVPFGNLLHLQAPILWYVNGTRIMVDGYRYVPFEDDIEMPKDLPGLKQGERTDL
jgi:hypothetical protein